MVPNQFDNIWLFKNIINSTYHFDFLTAIFGP